MKKVLAILMSAFLLNVFFLSSCLTNTKATSGSWHTIESYNPVWGTYKSGSCNDLDTNNGIYMKFNVKKTTVGWPINRHYYDLWIEFDTEYDFKADYLYFEYYFEDVDETEPNTYIKVKVFLDIFLWQTVTLGGEGFKNCTNIDISRDLTSIDVFYSWNEPKVSENPDGYDYELWIDYFIVHEH